MMKNMIKNICLIGFALIGPITLPAGGIQRNLYEYKTLNNSKEIILNESEIWVRVELFSNKLLDDPNKISKGWIKI